MILRQLSIAMSDTGVIGIGDELYITSSADMSNFARITSGTVMIAGFNTAQQMMKAQVPIAHTRPMVVISSQKRFLTDIHHPQVKANIFYAETLQKAVALAEQIVHRSNLNGWTVVGGASVYDAIFDAIDKGNVRLNNAYIHSFADVGSKPDQVKVSKDPDQLRNLIRARMIIPHIETVEADVNAAHNGTQGRIGHGRFTWMEDRNEIDSSSVKVCGNTLMLKLANSNLTIPVPHVSSYRRNYDTHTLYLSMMNGEQFEVRLKHPAEVPAGSGVNFLEKTLNQYLNH